MTYVLLIYRADGEATDDVPAEDRRALAAHRALQREAKGCGDLHAVARLSDPSQARTVRRAVSAHEVTDGPYIETKEWLVGFYLVDCADEEEALARARVLCDAHHAIEVRPVTWKHLP